MTSSESWSTFIFLLLVAHNQAIYIHCKTFLVEQSLCSMISYYYNNFIQSWGLRFRSREVIKTSNYSCLHKESINYYLNMVTSSRIFVSLNDCGITSTSLETSGTILFLMGNNTALFHELFFVSAMFDYWVE